MAVIGILLGNVCKDARVYPEMLQDQSCLSLSSLQCLSRHLQVTFTGIAVVQCGIFQVCSIVMQKG